MAEGVQMLTPRAVLQVRVKGNVGKFALDAAFSSKGLSTAIFGHSGAGKSTLIHMIAGLITPKDGRIQIGDSVVFDSEEKINLPVEERRVGLVFQDSRLFPHLNVEKNLMYGQWAAKRTTNLSLENVTRLLALDGLLDRYPRTLSGGERQRVAIGRALLSNPRVLLLDEPLASLDNPRKQEILPFLEQLAQKSQVPICYVSHSMDEVTRIADDLVILSRGISIGNGPLEEMLTRLDLGSAAGRHEASALLRAKVDTHHKELSLTRLMLDTRPPLAFEVTETSLPVGADVRLRVRARDVSLSLEPLEGISIRNQLPAVVEAIAPDDQGYAETILRLGAAGQGPRLRSRITAASMRDMKLVPGRPVFALVKSIAIERRLLQARDHVTVSPEIVAELDKSIEAESLASIAASAAVQQVEMSEAPLQEMETPTAEPTSSTHSQDIEIEVEAPVDHQQFRTEPTIEIPQSQIDVPVALAEEENTETGTRGARALGAFPTAPVGATASAAPANPYEIASDDKKPAPQSTAPPSETVGSDEGLPEHVALQVLTDEPEPEPVVLAQQSAPIPIAENTASHTEKDNAGERANISSVRKTELEKPSSEPLEEVPSDVSFPNISADIDVVPQPPILTTPIEPELETEEVRDPQPEPEPEPEPEIESAPVIEAPEQDEEPPNPFLMDEPTLKKS